MTSGVQKVLKLDAKKASMSLAKQLSKILRSERGERTVLRWLKENPLVLTQTIQFGCFAAAEFPFGSDFRADFIILGPFSGGWDIHFVELEPPSAQIFTRSGKPAKRFADAIAQVNSWRTFIEKNRSSVVRELSKFVQKRELVYGDRGYEPVDHCGWHLHHPRSQLNWQFEIIIGRLENLNDADVERKSSSYDHHGIEVMTFDRLVRTAESLDAQGRTRRNRRSCSFRDRS